MTRGCLWTAILTFVTIILLAIIGYILEQFVPLDMHDQLGNVFLITFFILFLLLSYSAAIIPPYVVINILSFLWISLIKLIASHNQREETQASREAVIKLFSKLRMWAVVVFTISAWVVFTIGFIIVIFSGDFLEMLSE